MLTNEELIRAIMVNIKNWSFDVFPKFSLTQEEAKALTDREALKAFLDSEKEMQIG